MIQAEVRPRPSVLVGSELPRSRRHTLASERMFAFDVIIVSIRPRLRALKRLSSCSNGLPSRRCSLGRRAQIRRIGSNIEFIARHAGMDCERADPTR